MSQDVDLREFVVTGAEAGRRLDVFLTRQMPDWSRSQLQRMILRGLVRIGSRVASKAGEKVEAGDTVTIRAEREALRAVPEELPLSILYEDEDLAVVEKPAGMVVHAGAGVKSGTLVNALLHHLGGGLSGVGGELRPGIVHRLDKTTSGLILVAKNDSAHRALADQFKSRSILKHYQLLVHGRLARDRGEIQTAVGRDPVRRVRMKVDGIGAREAVTAYRVVRRFPHFTLIEAEPHTGRTHQIRVHFASLRHPVVGDKVYGAPGKFRMGEREYPTLERNFLHAARIEFAHPRTGAPLSFTSPLPRELVDFLALVEREDR
ncbi:MAG TPA: RluA family pseudouridine synthase [Terriglobia bacterium]|nr:RluA family pseudouridine synthase [Terriglobia bacterium]